MYQSDSDPQCLSIQSLQTISTALPTGQTDRISLNQETSERISLTLTERHIGTVEQLANESESDSSKTITKIPNEQKLEYLVSSLLKYGVFLASTIVLIGGTLYLIRHGAESANYKVFRGEPDFLRSPVGVVKAVFCGSHLGMIQFGLLVLIATPVIRVAFSLLTFLWQRDFTYIIVTLLVMTGLIYSLIGAYVN